jgi:hypothetical protein
MQKIITPNPDTIKTIRWDFWSVKLSANIAVREDVESILRGDQRWRYLSSWNFSHAYRTRIWKYFQLKKRWYVLKTAWKISWVRYEEEMARLLIAAAELNSQLSKLNIQIINPLYANNDFLISEEVRWRVMKLKELLSIRDSLGLLMAEFLKWKKEDPLWKDIEWDSFEKSNFIKNNWVFYWIDPFYKS